MNTTIKVFQQLLNNLGYLATGYTVGEWDEATISAMQQFQRLHNLPVTEDLDSVTQEQLRIAEHSQEYIVFGQVLDDVGAIPECTLLIKDRDLGDIAEWQSVGDSVITDSEGRFVVRYTPAQIASQESLTSRQAYVADLVFLVSQEPVVFTDFDIIRLPDSQPINKQEQELGIQARRVEEVQIVLKTVTPRRLPASSEYERLLQRFQAVFGSERLPSSLDESKGEIRFVARELQEDVGRISMLANAFKLSADPFHFDVAPEVFYALARSRQLTTLADLAAAGIEKLVAGLKEAVDQNIVPLLDDDWIKSRAELIHQLAVPAALRRPVGADQPSYSQILSVALPDVDEQASLIRDFANHQGETPQFWENLRLQPAFAEPGKVERIQLSLQLDSLTQRNAPLINALQSEMGITSLRALLDLDPARFKELVQQSGVPADIPGESEDEKIATYIAGINRSLQRALPTESVAKVLSNVADVAVGGADLQRAVATFFANTTNAAMRQATSAFDIRTTQIDHYLAQHGELAFQQIDETHRSLVVAQVKRSQRLYRVSTSPQTFARMLESGLNSAYEIALIPQEQFVAQFKEQLGETEAKMIHANASSQGLSALHTYLLLNDTINGVQLPASFNGESPQIKIEQAREAVVKSLPSLRSLFGKLELCECEHCRSVYSPAAYLVDILSDLDNPKNSPPNPLAILLKRRPDLAHLQLTCENTNTLIPYVDLVNEVLESLVVNLPAIQIPAFDVQDETSTELQAVPQHTNFNAYVTPASGGVKGLDQAIFPLQLPFHLPWESVRTYLDHLGWSRRQLIETLKPNEMSNALAAEILNLSPGQFEVITGKKLDGTTTALAIDVDSLYGLVAPAVSSGVLSSVSAFLAKTDLTYAKVVDLLSLRFINPALSGFSVISDLELPGAALLNFVNAGFQNPEQGLVDALVAAQVDLADFTNWAQTYFASESWQQTILLDAAPDEPCNLELTTLRHWSSAMPLLQEAEWSKLNRMIRLWRSSGWSLAELNFALTAVNASELNEQVLRQLAHIKAASERLNLSIEQVTLLWRDFDPSISQSLYHKLFLNKAALQIDVIFQPDWKGAVLAGDVKIKEHLPVLLAAFQTRAADLALVRQYEHLQSDDAPLNLETLSKLYRHLLLAKTLRLAVRDWLILLNLSQLTPFTPPSENWDLQQEVDFVEQFQASGFSLGHFAYLLGATDVLSLPNEVMAQVLGVLKDKLNTLEAEIQLRPKPQTADEQQGQIKERQRLINQSLAEGLNIEAKTVMYLLESTLLPEVAGVALKDIFLNLPKVENDLAAQTAYKQLHKAALLITTFQLSSDEVEQLHQNNLLTFVKPIQAALLSIETWRMLAEYVSIRNRLPRTTTPFISLFSASDQDKWVELAMKATGWEQESLRALLAVEPLTFPINASQHLGYLARLSARRSLMRELGIAIEQANGLADDVVTIDAAEGLKRAVQARYSVESWGRIGKTLNDPLRDKRRSALVAYLLPKLGLQDADQLYEQCLIDVQMGACMMTSRIKQAISSVQLFIQRCLLNLEMEAPSDTIDTEHLKWKQNYRVWEANRKVLLYPENWIEPSLRDNKTPFFRELESELLQGDVTAENVEKAFLNYMAKLDEVAKLDIRAIYSQKDFEPAEHKKEVLHVFGRTPNLPHKYFYRQYVMTANDVGYWTAWESVPVDIQGDQLTTVVWNRRLYLFWPITMDKGRYEELQLAWSEYRNGKWSAKQVSTTGLRDKYLSAHHLEAHIEGSKLTIVFTQAIQSSNTINQLSSLGGSPDRTKAEYVIEVKEGGAFISAHCNGGFSPSQSEYTRKHRNGLSVIARNNNLTFETYGAKLQSYSILNATITNASLTGPQVPHRSGDYLFFQTQQGCYFLELTVPPERNKIDFSQPTPQLPVYPKDISAATPDLQFTQALLGSLTEIYANTGNRWGTIDATMAQYEIATQVDQSTNPIQTIADAGFNLDFPTYLQSSAPSLRFEAFYHPYLCQFIASLQKYGVAGLLTLENQRLMLNAAEKFVAQYKPNEAHCDLSRLVQGVDFGTKPNQLGLRSTAYATYNWEIFFHAPLLIADALNKNQRFEEALRWYHYVFDPTNQDQEYWRVLPLQGNLIETIENFLRRLNAGDKELEAQIKEWEDHPFQPHLLARMRLSAYQKHVVQKYSKNLLDWADQLFRRDTIESINQATQLYVLLAHLWGAKPQQLPARGDAKPMTFAQMRSELDVLGNALVEYENKSVFFSSTSLGANPEAAGLLGMSRSLYFCIPQNEQLLEFWNTIADRLFKIRNCMNIEGVVRQLPLFEPPIDPALLVQAAAKGLDLNSVLNDLNAPMPHYRFAYMLQKAMEVCNELKGLGSALLAALEKKEAEVLTSLRSAHEIVLLEMVQEVKQLQEKEAQESKQGLLRSRDVAVGRYHYYQFLMGVEKVVVPEIGQPIQLASVIQKPTLQEGAFLIDEEKRELDASHSARDWQVIASTFEILSSINHAVPNFNVPFAKPIFVVGGSNVGSALSAIARYFNRRSAEDIYDASHAGKMAGYQRRQQEWVQQANTAAREIMQIDKQILAAEIRAQIANNEIKNQEKQIENAKLVQEFLHTKFTNEELYSWMQGQVSTLYFQTYQLALDLAKKVERTFRQERGLTNSNFIQAGNWDSLRKGLLAGEHLALQLRQLERAYHDQNQRELEMTKHVSLLQLNPLALIELRTTGKCTIELPEALFDMDCPGHYFRRIKTVAVSIPCVTGPYTSINCTLTLLKSSIRSNALLDGELYERQGTEDTRFADHFGSVQSIVTSSGQNDSGLFETNLRDERYLPFENSGVISEWQLQLPANPSKAEPQQFDYNTISDVILHVRYTAREGGELLRKGALTNLGALIESAQAVGSTRLFSIRHEFPAEWARFQAVKIEGDTKTAELTLKLRPEHYPFWSQERLQNVKEALLIARTTKDSMIVTKSSNGSGANDSLTNKSLVGLLQGKLENCKPAKPAEGVLQLFLNSNQVDDLWLAVTWMT